MILYCYIIKCYGDNLVIGVYDLILNYVFKSFIFVFNFMNVGSVFMIVGWGCLLRRKFRNCFKKIVKYNRGKLFNR